MQGDAALEYLRGSASVKKNNTLINGNPVYTK